MQTITTRNLARAMRGDRSFRLVDVLPTSAHERAHIPTSINLPLEATDFVDRAAALLDMATPVVVYCADSACDASREAAAALQSAGFQEVYDYAGGLDAWRRAGHPIVSAATSEQS